MPMTLSGDGTITGLSAGGLPDGSVTAADLASGAARTNFGAGAALQVVTFKYSTGQTFSSIASLTYQDTGLTASITPSSTNSKVLVLVTASHQSAYTGTSNIGSTLAVKRGSTRIIEGVGNHVATISNGETLTPTGNIVVLDSPASTSSVTYTVQIAPRGATTTVYFNRNYSVTGFDATITLMEIAG